MKEVRPAESWQVFDLEDASAVIPRIRRIVEDSLKVSKRLLTSDVFQVLDKRVEKIGFIDYFFKHGSPPGHDRIRLFERVLRVEKVVEEEGNWRWWVHKVYFVMAHGSLNVRIYVKQGKKNIIRAM